MYKKIEWPEWQEMIELEGFEDDSYFVCDDNIYFVSIEWLESHGYHFEDNISPKYKIGDIVYLMKDNKVSTMEISSIRMDIEKNGNKIIYRSKLYQDPYSGIYTFQEEPESKLFPNKQELLNFL